MLLCCVIHAYILYSDLPYRCVPESCLVVLRLGHMAYFDSKVVYIPFLKVHSVN